MRHEFQRQRLGRRPGQGGPGRRQRPGLEIGEIGGERPKAVLAHPFLGEMLEGRDVVVGQNLGEAIAPVHRQDRRQGVEFERAPRQRIAGAGQGRDRSWLRQRSEHGNRLAPRGGGEFAIEGRERGALRTPPGRDRRRHRRSRPAAAASSSTASVIAAPRSSSGRQAQPQHRRLRAARAQTFRAVRPSRRGCGPRARRADGTQGRRRRQALKDGVGGDGSVRPASIQAGGDGGVNDERHQKRRPSSRQARSSSAAVFGPGRRAPRDHLLDDGAHVAVPGRHAGQASRLVVAPAARR